MGKMTFQVPVGLPAEARRELERSCLAGGPDNMPWPTGLRFDSGGMTVLRAADESGYLAAPWAVDGVGRVMGTSATLVERARPYHLLVELARGKVNQVRCQLSDWRFGGLNVPSDLDELVRIASRAFGEAITGPPEEADARATAALARAYAAADCLVHAYAAQVFQVRHQRQPRLDTALGCRVGTAPPASLASDLAAACNTVAVPLSWHTVEGEEASYHWDAADALVAWAAGLGPAVVAGPLIDFSASQLPAWLWLWERDLPSLTAFMCRYVETAVRRYRQRIRRWQVTAASNWARCLSLSEEDLLQLTYRLGEAALQADPGVELVIGIAQPWGEYMAATDRTHSPFIFADTLIRSGLNLSALDVEVVMGVEPRGSYCRDLLELSRLLDLYALLGVPLRVTLGYPSAEGPDHDADPELQVGAGHWGGGFTPSAQAEWAAAFTALCVCKPYVQGVQWTHLSDATPHLFPHCGLADHTGTPKPALAKLREVREAHLR
jgi:hypothetical protein